MYFWFFLSFCLFITVDCRLNFVILLADDLGIGDVGCFGNKTINTPNIDALAQSGAILTHHVTAAAVCTPSRTALLTGRYPVRSGMESTGRNKVFFFVASTGGLPSNETTIAKALKKKGYNTAIVGKWHLGNNGKEIGDLLHHPLGHGFDRFYGLPLSNFKDLGKFSESVITAYVPNLFRYMIAAIVCIFSLCIQFFPRHKKCSFFVFIIAVLAPAMIVIFLLNLKLFNGILMRNDQVIEQPLVLEGLTQRFVKESIEFIEENAKTRTPFFLYLPFVHVHTALFATKDFRGKSLHGPYGDNVEELDWAVGQITNKLSTLGISNDTLVYFSSDNGGHIEEVNSQGQKEGGHNGIYKGGKTMAGYEGGIRVPSIISWPGKIDPGIIIKPLTSQMDIYPTIMELANIPQTNDRIVDGKSLIPLITRPRMNSHHKILFHYCGVHIHAATYVPDDASVWKIHWTTPKFVPNTTRCGYVCHCFGNFVIQHDPPLLLDLVQDPSESNILDAELSKHMEIIDRANKLRKLHEASVEEVQSQFSFSNTIWKPWLQPCCNFPSCYCRDPKYNLGS